MKLMYDPDKGIMRVACFVSGSGTNARKIIERSLREDSSYEVVLVFSDVRDSRFRRDGGKMCKGKDISEEYGISYESRDIRDFYSAKGVKRSDLSIRPEFDEQVVEAIGTYGIDLIANAGYMSIMTAPILEEYRGRIVNVHPADLRIREGGERKYTGIHVVEEAILAGDDELRSTTHVVRSRVDYGEMLLISEPVQVELPEDISLEELKEDRDLLSSVVDEHQDRLKRKGDWVIYPLTIQMIGEGRFALDGRGKVWLDGELLYSGYVLGGN
jgi:folate-dependent phosphoribosylglycinamide formyltransferase PurN